MQPSGWFVRGLAVLVALASASALAQNHTHSSPAELPPAAVFTDPPPNKAFPAAMDAFTLPSHGAALNAIVYVAAGAGPHPIALLLHGFPGNERNLDLAQALRRAGWDVLYFNYRGSWGSPGSFSFANSLEDVESALAYLTAPENARRLRADPHQIVLMGHSMGGFLSAEIGARHPEIKAIVLISAAGMADRVQLALHKADRTAVIAETATDLAHEGMEPLAGCTPESLAGELADHADDWSLASPALAAGLARHPLFVVTSDDGLAPFTDILVGNVKKQGKYRVAEAHFATDHAYSDQRIALQSAVLKWLAELPREVSRP